MLRPQLLCSGICVLTAHSQCQEGTRQGTIGGGERTVAVEAWQQLGGSGNGSGSGSGGEDDHNKNKGNGGSKDRSMAVAAALAWQRWQWWQQ